ncbi:MAG: cadherin domain-containing protein, partial [Acidimicrobiales bacterium]
PAISADGKTVVYESQASNLVAADTSFASDIFAYDLATGTTTQVSVASDGSQLDAHSTRPTVSADGMIVAYMSGDIFVHDWNTGVRTRASVAIDGGQADASCWYPAISGDGSTVAYGSTASNLVPSDTNNDPDIFVHNLIDGTTIRVSVAADGTEANDSSQFPAISADGKTIAYASEATNLVSGAVDPNNDVFATKIDKAPEASGFNATIAEDMPVGTELGTVAANDADGDPLSYDIITGNDVGMFGIGDNGTVTLANALDYESTSQYDLSVEVSDGVLSDTAIVTVDVTNVNEPPDVSGLAVAVAENAPLGTVLGTVSASDQENDDLTFAITSGNNNSMFAVGNDGAVTVAGALDYETTSHYDLSVEVSDGELLDTAIVAVDVTNVNEAPIAEDLVTAVPEDTAIGTELATVTVSDPENDPLSFAITAGDDAGLFSINGAGVVRLVAAVDYQTATQHVLTVTVSDGELSDTATVTINVTEADEVDPDVGPFTDTVGSIFAVDIEWLAISGITRGCNPPVNDEFCPDDFVTRGQMAAFLVRALGLPATSDDYFSDDDGTIFEDAINRLAASGITRGCNPPTNDTFCPNGNVTRGQMAAFLARALGYADDGGGDLFTDDDGSIFEDAIDKLAAAGITRGCNPPANTDYCPNNNVTRSQMAAFLHRAFG